MEREKNLSERIAENVAAMGCFGGLIAPLVALVIYPHGKWLFWGPVLSLLLLILLNKISRQHASPGSIADGAEDLLEGRGGRWGVDDYENIYPTKGRAYDLWRETFAVGGMPEDWPRLDDQKKQELRRIIAELRTMADAEPQ